MGSQNEGGAFFAGLVIGGLVGAALALLLAPQSGEETRAQIRDRSLEYKDLAEDNLMTVRSRATEAGLKAQEQVAALQAKSMEAIEKGKVSAAEALEKGKQSATEALEKGKQSATEALQKGKDSVGQAMNRTSDGAANEAG
ncbi:MAG: YtxH domain-containing protein [Anaerolineae bacterium]|nr:YtxH domain-containing protein [Anaerolineae bacterium]